MHQPRHPLHLNRAGLRYAAMLGVGGIGFGEFFQLTGNHTLGREESRAGRFLDRRDYCKLHIISHYVKVLLGPGFAVYPIGRIGGDDVGRRIMGEIREIGIEDRFILESQGAQTLYSLCFIYPDGSGGNLTTEDSACAGVDAAAVDAAAGTMREFAGRGVALAVPEVPLSARRRMLELATAHKLLRCAAFNSGEIDAMLAGGFPAITDLLALNIHEAAMIAGLDSEKTDPEAIIDAAVSKLRGLNPWIMVSFTVGSRGSWLWDGQRLSRQTAITIPPVSTAGAGDAHFGGLIVGLVAGLPPADAHQLAALVASHKITSRHTIDARIDRVSLAAFAAENKIALNPALAGLMRD